MAIAFDVDRPFPENAQRDISGVITNAGKLVKIMESFQTRAPDFSPSPVFGLVAAELSMTFQDVSRTFSALQTLNEISEQAGGISGLLAILQKRLSPERTKALETNSDDLRNLLDIYNRDHPIAISIKAEKISFLHENLYQDGEIITDARPVFNSAGARVLEIVINHSFVLNYFSYGDGSRRMHFAMDAADVSRLREACDRAMIKAKTLKEALEGKEWTVKVLNESGGNA